MKTKLLSAVLLSMTSLFSVAQSEYTSPEVSPYDKAKELKAFDASNASVEINYNRSTECVDTSYFPRLQTTGLYIGTLNAQGESEVGQAYRNQSSIEVTGVYAWLNNILTDAKISASVYEFKNNKPGNLLYTQWDIITDTDSTYALTINFDTPVEVDGDYLITIGVDTSDVDELVYIFDYQSNNRDHLGWVKINEGDTTWLGLDEAGFDEYFGTDTHPDSIDYLTGNGLPVKYDHMIFPIYETTLEATIASDDVAIVPGATAEFTSTINAPGETDTMTSVSSFYGLSNYTWWVVQNNEAIAFSDSSIYADNYEYQFDTAGDYLVEVRAVQGNWGYIFTGQFKLCADIDYLTVNVDTANAATDTSVSSINELTAEIASMSAFPNPATDFVNIEFTLNENADVTVELYNMVGQKLEATALSNQGAGTHKVELNVTSLTKGTYFYSVTANGNTTSGNFNISK